MKNKKGFTLVELLAVIVILAIIITIAIPSTISISNRLKENMYCKKIDSIEVAAKLYGEDRKSSFNDTYKDKDQNELPSQTIKVEDLISTGYLKKDNMVKNSDDENAGFIEDPRDDSSLDKLEMTLYIKYDRVYVAFSEDVNKTCNKK